MKPTIFDDVVQGEKEWFDLRCGVVTASKFSTVMAKGRGSYPSKTRQTYMLELAGEIVTGTVQESYGNAHMARGNQMEPEARELYEMASGNGVKEVGFIKSLDTIGYSPDGMIGDDGLLEIKTKLPHLQIALLLSDKFPSEHRHQCQGGMWVSGREWIDFVSYWPGLPLFVKRVHRDEAFILEIEAAVYKFIQDLGVTVDRVKAL